MRGIRFMGALAILGMVAQPTAAAELAGEQRTRMGAFGGFRIQLPLGARGARDVPRAGLAFGPVQQSRSSDGASRTRLGEGLMIGFGGGERGARVTLAGTRLDRLGLVQNGRAPEGGQRAGISTLGWVAIGVGAAVVIGLAGTYLWIDDAVACRADEDCN